MTYTVKENQNLFDVYFQHFGNEDGFWNFLSDNNLQIDTVPESGDVYIINNEGIGDENIKREIIKNNLLFANKYLTLIGDFTDDFSEDFFI